MAGKYSTIAWTSAERGKARRDNAPSNIRNVIVGGHRTSMRLEPQMWSALAEVAGHYGISVSDLVTHIVKTSADAGGSTSAVRVYLMEFYRNRFNGSAGVRSAPMPVSKESLPPPRLGSSRAIV